MADENTSRDTTVRPEGETRHPIYWWGVANEVGDLDYTIVMSQPAIPEFVISSRSSKPAFVECEGHHWVEFEIANFGQNLMVRIHAEHIEAIADALRKHIEKAGGDPE